MKNSDKRADIMQAAMELIAARGFHGAPMAVIAEKADVAAGTIYRYFENKDVLIAELHRDLEDKILEALPHLPQFSSLEDVISISYD